MTTGEHKIVRDFVLADDRNWATACAIQGALPEIGAAVRRQFLDTIANRLKGLGYESEEPEYSDKAYQSWVQAYLPQCQDAPGPEWTRVSLRLEAGEARGNGWYIGIHSPVSKSAMSAGDLTQRKLIEKRLKESLTGAARNSDSWLWYEYFTGRYYNWDGLIFNMHRELQQDGGGEITDYFVGKFVEIAKVARPILNDVEGNRPG